MRIHALLFCLFSTSAFALYGGRPASSSSHLVNLQVGKDVFCQGVALSKTKILTAGHCIEEMGVRLNENSQILTYYPETVSVVFGRESVRAKEITFAPSMFDGGVLAEDIALVELKSPLNGVEVLPIAQHSDLVPGAMMLLKN